LKKLFCKTLNLFIFWATKMKEDIENVRGLPPAYFDASKKEANESCSTLTDRAIGESENPVDLVDEWTQKDGVGLNAACGRNIHCSS